MKQFTVWYAGSVIADSVWSESAADVAQQYEAGEHGTLVVTLEDATQEQNQTAKIASLVKP